MCPLKRNRLELCRDGLSSLMINKQCCFKQSYESCPICLIEARKRDEFNHAVMKNDNHHNITENLVLYPIEMDSFKLNPLIGLARPKASNRNKMDKEFFSLHLENINNSCTLIDYLL